MPSTYTVNLGIEKPATGEQSGTWGDTTNTNFDILDQGINGAVRVTLTSAGSSGSPNALQITNGAVSDGRNKFIEFFSSGDLGGSAYVQLDPNDAEKIVFIRNSLASSRSVLLFQGTYSASRDLEIPAGVDMVVKFDGGGASSATVTDVFTKLRVTELTTPTLTATTADINGGTLDNSVIGGATPAAITGTTIVANTSLNIAGDGATVTGIKDEDDMASNSATKLATQQSIKAYVDSQVGTVDTLAEILANGNTSGSNNLVIDNGQALTSNTINETTAGSGVTIDSVLLKDDVVNATDVETGSISANDGTASATIANSTGVMTIASSVLTTTDINGGTIDNTNIGASTPGTGAFTTLSSTSTVSFSGDLTVLSSDAGSSYGPNLTLRRDSASPADNDFAGRILWQADNDAGENTSYAALHTRLTDVSDGSEDGLVQLDVMVAGSSTNLLDVGASGIVVNDGSVDVDFRVESNGNANMLFVDAGNDRVGVGTGSPSHTMHVVSSGNGEIKAERTSGAAVIIQAQSAAGKIGTTTNHTLGLNTNGTTRVTVDTNGKVLINDTSSHTSDLLQIETPASGGGHGIQIRRNDANSDQTVGAVTFGNNTDTDLAQISAKTDGDSNSGDSGALLFSTQATSGSLTERARITSAGKIRLGNSADHVLVDVSASNAALELIDNNQSNPPTLRGNGPNFTIENGGLEMMRITSTTETVFNEQSQNIDFRVESDNDTHALFVDAGNGVVGIAQSSPSSYNSTFNDLVVGASGATGITVVSGTGNAGTLAFADGTSGDAAYRGYIQYNHATDGLALGSAGATALTLDANGTIITSANGKIESASSLGSLTISGGATNKGGQILLRGGNGDSDIVFKSQASTATPQEVARVGPAETVINEGSLDYDFRVEGSSNANLLFVDAGNERVLFGTNNGDIDGSVAGVSITETGEIRASTASTTFLFAPFIGGRRGTNNTGDVLMLTMAGFAKSSVGVLGESNSSDNGGITLNTISGNATKTERLRTTPSETVINEPSNDHDFRVESNSNTHMLYVDAGSDFVGINTSSPNTPLHVQTSHSQTNVTLANTNSTLNLGNTAAGDGIFNAIKFSGNQQDMYIMSINDSTQRDRRLGFFVGSVAGDSTGDQHLSITGSGALVTSADNAASTVTLTGLKSGISDNVATSFAKIIANNNEIHGHLVLKYNLESPGQNIGVGQFTFRVFYNGGTTLLDQISANTTVYTPTITATASGSEFTLKVQMDTATSTFDFDYSLEFLSHNTNVAVANMEEL